ncbi:MAG TPA: hypothetical protein VFL14_07500, partial [Xanthomonadales bacterium]|nr:hypothetical protein [Xanthomonadales bacterium]
VASARQQDAGRGSANDPAKRFVTFVDERGERANLHYGAALFRFERGNVITPHGHRYMVSAHLVLDGELRVRTFDRAGEDGDALLLRDGRDGIARRGDVSTMSPTRRNVHWFVPRGAAATTFDVVVSDLEPGRKSFEIQPVDILRATSLRDGTLRAPVIGFAESSERYTARV